MQYHLNDVQAGAIARATACMRGSYSVFIAWGDHLLYEGTKYRCRRWSGVQFMAGDHLRRYSPSGGEPGH